jgi:MarR family transcriptional regulator, organic hydroperoxide resistance regulator
MENTELIEQVLELQQQADSTFRHFSPKHWIDLNLSIAQLKSLLFIASKGKTNFKKIAEALGVTPPNITGIIDRLVEQDLVSRNENPEDRRVMLLELTEKGQELLFNLRERRVAYMRQVLVRMNAEELNSLSIGLSALIKAASGEKLDNPPSYKPEPVSKKR